MKSIKIITKEETNAIREMYATGIPSQNALANHVGTSRYYIGKMVRDIVPDGIWQTSKECCKIRFTVV